MIGQSPAEALGPTPQVQIIPINSAAQSWEATQAEDVAPSSTGTILGINSTYFYIGCAIAGAVLIFLVPKKKKKPAAGASHAA